MRVTVYGDSILKGVLLDDGKYVVDHTWETLLSEKFHLTIRNCARFGCTIQKILPLIRRDSQRKSEARMQDPAGSVSCSLSGSHTLDSGERSYPRSHDPAPYSF